MITVKAQNKSGAIVEFKANSLKSALNLFDKEYDRKGFKITAHNEYGCLMACIKKAFN